jgi:hypothetical protein
MMIFLDLQLFDNYFVLKIYPLIWRVGVIANEKIIINITSFLSFDDAIILSE